MFYDPPYDGPGKEQVDEAMKILDDLHDALRLQKRNAISMHTSSVEDVACIHTLTTTHG